MPPFFRPVVAGVNRYDALLSAQIGHLPEAINVMKMYLKLVPRPRMRAKIADRSGRDFQPSLPAAIPIPPGWDSQLGIGIANLPAIVATVLGKPDLEGALVTFVLSGSPADRMGLKKKNEM